MGAKRVVLGYHAPLTPSSCTYHDINGLAASVGPGVLGVPQGCSREHWNGVMQEDPNRAQAQQPHVHQSLRHPQAQDPKGSAGIHSSIPVAVQVPVM